MILFPEGKPTVRETYEQYCAAGGYQAVRRNPGSEQIIAEVSDAGLRGRGGAGFPAGRKWAIAAATGERPVYLVCNAGEDEPGSFKDRVLLEHRPHLVLEGMVLAAKAIGATETFVYLNETYEDAHARIAEAVGEARAAGDLPITVTIHKAPTVYVAGEDSAALEVLEGRAPKPRQKPPYPATAGLFGKPTISITWKRWPTLRRS